MRQRKKAEADAQRRQEKAAKEQSKAEREARSYNSILQASHRQYDSRSESVDNKEWCYKQPKENDSHQQFYKLDPA